MDPTATLRDLMNAMAEQDAHTIERHAINLLVWLDRGGFPPLGMTREKTAAACEGALDYALVLMHDYDAVTLPAAPFDDFEEWEMN